jgi:trans-AT polyketide synthase, acyltransferase and oxidoreductase domains
MIDNGLRFYNTEHAQPYMGSIHDLVFNPADVRAALLRLDQPVYVVQHDGSIGLTHTYGSDGVGDGALLTYSNPVSPAQLGSAEFRAFYGVKYAYAAGAMANGIASEALVIALGQQGILASFGAAGLVPDRVLSAIHTIKQALPNGPYAFNLIHSPSEDAIERRGVELFLEHEITTVEASAFLELTPHVVHYRVAGLSQDQQGNIVIKNRVIAKISRREVAQQFMQPAPERLLNLLLQQGKITEQQARLAAHVPMADDVTAEADSGGHTDNRPLVVLLPSIMSLRDELQAKHRFPHQIRVGAAGGISTPQSVLAAFMMGADYVVTGSVNQACIEAGASDHTKRLLAQAEMPDVIMAPAADMFEMGVRVQVLKRGTFFPMRAIKLYELYREYDGIHAIPQDEREKVEKQVFRRNLDDVWADTVSYFMGRDPEQIERVKDNPKGQMGLIFRWYLGLSSRWSNVGEKGREPDYQIWCGPSMGAFNDWARGSYLEKPENRRVAEIADHLMIGAAYLYRIQTLRVQGLQIPVEYSVYHPEPL